MQPHYNTHTWDMPHASPLIELTIEKPAVGGRMIARHHGRVVLVSSAIPGERVVARVERAGRDVAYAVVTEVLEPDRDRRPVVGDPACGGNVYAHVAYDRQLALKSTIVADAFARIGRIELDVPVPAAPSRERGYRMRARLHVRGTRIGFVREGSHELCDAARTGQLLPETGAVLDRLSGAMRAIRPVAVRGLDLAENLAADQHVLHFELEPDGAGEGAELAGLGQIEGVTGLTAAPSRGAPPALLAGVPYVSDPLSAIVPSVAGARGTPELRRHAAAFFQGNRYLLPRLVSRVIEHVSSGEIVELYAGVGVFAVALAAAGRGPVTAVEGDSVSAADLHANAASFAEVLRVEHAPVEAYLRRRAGPSAGTLVIDPPRTGLSREAITGAIRHGAARIVYVSCDVATLARDVRKFVDAGYMLSQIEAFDLFPNTAHVEVLAVLVRD